MKIGIDARMYGARQTGIGIYIENLIKNILENDSEDEFILFLSDSSEEARKQLQKYKNIRLVKADIPWYSYGEQAFFPFLIGREELDLMHFPHFNVPIFCPVKFVVTIHDMTPKYFPGNKVGKSFFRRMMFDLVMRSGLRRAEKIIAVSNFTKDEILRFFPKIKKEKIEVIYEGLREEFFDIAPDERASSETLASLPAASLSKNLFSDVQLYQKTPSKFFSIASSDARSSGAGQYLQTPFIFYTGVWRDHKNLVGLIKAFKILKEKYKIAHKLVLGGSEDDNYPEVREAWEKLGLGKDIVLTGFLNFEDQKRLYWTCDLYVQPSFSEGFSFTPLEAMSQGAVVALSNIPVHREISGDLPVYFDPNDPEDMAGKIYSALTDKNLREKFLSRGAEQAKKYRWEYCAKETFTKVYKSDKR